MEQGRVIEGRYVVEQALASGGMATVWRVRHQALDSLHALKILHLPSPDIRQRLLLEGRLQAKLRHPNIVAVTDILTVDGNPGLVMEYVDGPSLEEWLAHHQPTPEQTETLFLGILAAVDHAHQNGVVHRDLKPANVLLAPLSGGVLPKVADFGIARVVDDVLDAKSGGQSRRTRSGVMMGTPAYMAPEQSESASEAGVPADLFALGCILYELAVGRCAFDGPHIGAILLKVANQDYEDPASIRPDLRPGVAEAIRRTLVADPTARLASCSELAAVLTDGRVTTLSGQSDAPMIASVPRPPTRNPSAPAVRAPYHGPGDRTLWAGLAVSGMAGLAGLILLGAGAVAGLTWWWTQPAPDPGPTVVASPAPDVPAPEPLPTPTLPVPAPAPVPTVVAPAHAPAPQPAPQPVVEPAPVVAPVPAPVPAPEPAPQPVVAPPEPGTPWRVTVGDWRRATQTSKGTVLRYQPEPGRALVLVDVAVRFDGPSAVEPTNPWRLLVRGGSGPVEASSRCGVAVPDGLSSLARFEPGSVTRGTLCFEVRSGTVPRALRFASELQGGTTLDVDL